jgi:PhzF family phenazine biosynthesis protein
MELIDRNIINIRVKNDIDIVLVFSTEVSSNKNHYRTRVFAPKFGYLEDPATGSGNSAFGYYLLKKKLWNGNNINIEQKNSYDIFNIVKLVQL